MQADINGNPVLLEFEEFKKLDLPERRQVLFSILVDLLPLRRSEGGSISKSKVRKLIMGN